MDGLYLWLTYYKLFLESSNFKTRRFPISNTKLKDALIQYKFDAKVLFANTKYPPNLITNMQLQNAL